jgi:hypothetical protein
MEEHADSSWLDQDTGAIRLVLLYLRLVCASGSQENFNLKLTDIIGRRA